MFENIINSKPYRTLFIILSVLLVATMMVAIIPSWREKAQQIMWPRERIILAKSQGPLEPSGPFVTVIKVKTKEGLFVEIYKGSDADAPMEFWTQFPLEGKQDGFFNYQKQAANLVLTDVDNDGYNDIVAPTFDEQMQPRMNVFRYDVATESFMKMEKNF